MTTPFVHLHCHTHYSLLDGAGKVPDLLNLAKSYDMEALAITDHGNMCGAIEFYSAAIERGIRPIIGYEAYVAPVSRSDRSKDQKAGGYYHQTLLAMNNVGYHNLIKLASIAYQEGFYRKPRIDFDLLKQFNEGIICLSGCLRSEIAFNASKKLYNTSIGAIDRYLEVFGDRFYMELQYNGIPLQHEVSLFLGEVANKKGIPLVLTNDVHYPTKASAATHDVLLCIQTKSNVNDENRFSFDTNEFYLKTGDEMANVLPQFPSAISNTVEVARRCNVDIKFQQYHLPPFIPPKRMSVEEYLHHLCIAGLKKRYGDPIPQSIIDRFNTEYSVISSMGFAPYFLIVEDFISHAKSNGIFVGPGRGSAAGSIISYALGITSIDPTKYGLIFERFLNEGRNDLPDIDIDFDAERRSEVVDYVVAKYGRNNVCQIATFGKIQARLAIKDIARVLNVDYKFASSIADLIPKTVDITIDKALEQEKRLKELYDTNQDVANLIDIARAVEGTVRNMGIHAAGIIISDSPVSDYCPIAVTKDGIVTQYSMEYCEKVGLLKMDFLGLKNLTVINQTIELIKKKTGTTLDPELFPIDDIATYKTIAAGDTKGIFQLEGGGIRDLVTRLRPDCIEDIIAIVAIYRPGPLGSGMIDDFIKCKHGINQVEYLHPMLANILKETYGLIIYQEQVMQIANVMGGFSLSDADRLRKAMGKKKADLMEKYKSQFIEGAKKKNITDELATKVFDLMAEFAKYGFNKSHSAAYAMISFYTAYLKTHYRIEFMAALISCHVGEEDRVNGYVSDVLHEGIKVLPPDINKSDARFTVEGPNIRFGLTGIKHCSENAILHILEKRKACSEFKDLFDFCQSVDKRIVNKSTIEHLIMAGACDGLGGHRAQLFESFARYTRKQPQGTEARQIGLFDDMDDPEPGLVLPTVEPWDARTMLSREKGALGMYISGHPLTPYRDVLDKFCTSSAAGLRMFDDKAIVRVGGFISRAKQANVKSGKNAGKRFAHFVLEDFSGECEVVCFTEVYSEYHDIIKDDNFVLIVGELDSGYETKIKMMSAIPLEESFSSFTHSVSINLQQCDISTMRKIELTLSMCPGNIPVYIYAKSETGPETAVILAKSSVSPCIKLACALASVIGKENFSFDTIHLHKLFGASSQQK